MKEPSQTSFQGKTPSEIRSIITLRDEDVEHVSHRLAEDSRRVSETVSRGRRNERVRIKLCLYLNMAYEALWGGQVLWRQVPAGLHADYEARFGAANEAGEIAA